MNAPENPYNERVADYKERALQRDYSNETVFFLDKTWFDGQEKGWNEGRVSGIERYFNLDSQNDCADTLFTYLATLQAKVEKEFGEGSTMNYLLNDLLFNLGEASIPINPPETEEEGVWLQPFEYSDEEEANEEATYERKLEEKLTRHCY